MSRRGRISLLYSVRHFGLKSGTTSPRHITRQRIVRGRARSRVSFLILYFFLSRSKEQEAKKKKEDEEEGRGTRECVPVHNIKVSHVLSGIACPTYNSLYTPSESYRAALISGVLLSRPPFLPFADSPAAKQDRRLSPIRLSLSRRVMRLLHSL